MSVCLHKPGKRVIVYAPDHKHYSGTVTRVTRRGAPVRVLVGNDRRTGEYGGTDSVHVNSRVFAPLRGQHESQRHRP